MINFICGYNKLFLADTFDFTVDEATEILNYMGLVNGREICRVESLEKYIFLYGDEQEIYNSEERKFIKDVGNIYIYNEFRKKTKRGFIPCRIIAAKIETNDSIKSCIFIMKEVNKAIDGFNIFLFKAGCEFYFGIRMFNEDPREDCALSTPIKSYEDFEIMCDKLLYLPEDDEFIPYYTVMVSATESNEDDFSGVKKREVQHSYLEVLSEIEQSYNVSLEWEKNRYYQSLEKECKVNFKEIIKEVCLELEFIESFKANTMEMLFEAEEMSLLSNETEEENNTFVDQYKQERYSKEIDDNNMKVYLDDPEIMIKLLKQQKGI